MSGPVEDRTSPGRCNYCGATGDADSFTSKEVIHRKWDVVRQRQYVGKTRFTVCAGKPCGAHLQMGFEG